MNTAVEGDSRLSLGQSFSIAAWVVILGVVGSWVYLKQGAGQVAANLPEIPSFTLTTVQDVSEVTWNERAEQAYAAGRITRPEGDSALFFYQKIQSRDPQNSAAKQGIERVLGYLINGAESALLGEDWLTAADFAEQALGINKNHLAARSVMSRVQRYERIKLLNDRAVEQIAAGNLTRPEDDNALASYREILSMDPANVAAQQGIESVAQRLATIAQSEAFAENHERARELIAMAKSIAPNASGIAQTEKLTMQWTDMVKDQAVKDDLLAAAKALQEGYLVGVGSPDGLGALDHFRSVLKKDPNSAAAQAGVQLVISGLIDRAWSLAKQDMPFEVDVLIRQAKDAGAIEAQLVEVVAELNFLSERAAARAGNFDEVLPIGRLTSRRQSAPVLPRNADGGWVEVLFTVTETGDVVDVVVVEASNDVLKDPAANAVEKWRFDPFFMSGRPIPVRSGIRFTFQT
jgi:TonB family protein